MSAPRYPDAVAGGACLSCGVAVPPGGRLVHGATLRGVWRICGPCNGLRTRDDMLCRAVEVRHGEAAAATVRRAGPLAVERRVIGPRQVEQFAAYSPEQAAGPVDAWELQAVDLAAIYTAALELAPHVEAAP